MDSGVRTHIILPNDLAAGIDRVAGKRGRSRFIIAAARTELRRQLQLNALEKSAGAWRDEDHPELKGGARKWVARIRAESERRRG